MQCLLPFGLEPTEIPGSDNLTSYFQPEWNSCPCLVAGQQQEFGLRQRRVDVDGIHLPMWSGGVTCDGPTGTPLVVTWCKSICLCLFPMSHSHHQHHVYLNNCLHYLFNNSTSGQSSERMWIDTTPTLSHVEKKCSKWNITVSHSLFSIQTHRNSPCHAVAYRKFQPVWMENCDSA